MVNVKLSHFVDITKIATQGVKNTSIQKPGKVLRNHEKFSLGENIDVPQNQASTGIRFTPIDALFLNLDQHHKRQRQAIEKSDQILNQLDNLRMGIITGSIPRETLENITTLLQTHSQTITEEPLRTLILEVETRAKVELAKLEKLKTY